MEDNKIPEKKKITKKDTKHIVIIAIGIAVITTAIIYNIFIFLN